MVRIGGMPWRSLSRSGLAKQPQKRSGEVVRVPGSKEQPVPFMFDGLRDAANPRGDDRNACEKRFLDDERAVLGPDRRHNEHVD
jgi:hypothetical protein